MSGCVYILILKLHNATRFGHQLDHHQAVHNP
jgi:hypothetical protein